MSEYPEFYTPLLSSDIKEEDIHNLLTLLEEIEQKIDERVSSLYVPHKIIKKDVMRLLIHIER